MSEVHKHAEVASRTPEFMAGEARKPFGWGDRHFVEWATVEAMLEASGVRPGARILDVGCGVGWTSEFLARAGYEVLGVDLVPANVEAARERGSGARFAVADMDELALDEPPFDAALLFDALHHSARQPDVLAGIARHLRLGGALLLGEPTFLHRHSPTARRDAHERGWLERGLTMRELRRDLSAAGFADVRRFYQGTRPHTGARGFLGELARLVGARLVAAPQHHLWVSARCRSPLHRMSS